MEKVFGGDISLLNEFSQFMPDDDDEDVVMGESTTTVSVLGEWLRIRPLFISVY